MQNKSTIALTEDEQLALKNVQFFINKQSATKKIQEQFHFLKDNLSNEAQHHLSIIPKEADVTTGRIFRGENYNGLPYIMLDFPRMFNKTDVFSFRNMCWWGMNYSFTLHLSGKSLEVFRNKILDNIHRLKGNEFYFCVNDNPWEYHFEEGNYKPLDHLLEQNSSLPSNEMFQQDFLKLSRKLDISCWDEIIHYGTQTFCLCMELLK